MRKAVVLLLAFVAAGGVAAGCGSTLDTKPVAAPPEATTHATTTAATPPPSAPACDPAAVTRLGSQTVAYAGVAANGAVARTAPGGSVRRRFGARNENGYPTVFGVVGVVKDRACHATWYRVQLPIKPNGATGFVRASSLAVSRVRTRIVVDLSRRKLTAYDAGKQILSATVAVGAPSTPTPRGRYYVNQRLQPASPDGPYGPYAIGISAYSNVLTGWAQGGPIAIHGTNEPSSIGRDISHGCIRLPNATLLRLYPYAVAGTPVVVKA
jgi:lipoprotein-anchoring transpeptidase ErfK/SrfK